MMIPSPRKSATRAAAAAGLAVLLTFACSPSETGTEGSSQPHAGDEQPAPSSSGSTETEAASPSEQAPPQIESAGIRAALQAEGFESGTEPAPPLRIATPEGTEHEGLHFEHPEQGVATVHLYRYPNARFVEAPYSDFMFRARERGRPFAAVRASSRLVVIEALDRGRAQRVAEVLATHFGVELEPNFVQEAESPAEANAPAEAEEPAAERDDSEQGDDGQ